MFLDENSSILCFQKHRPNFSQNTGVYFKIHHCTFKIHPCTFRKYTPVFLRIHPCIFQKNINTTLYFQNTPLYFQNTPLYFKIQGCILHKIHTPVFSRNYSDLSKYTPVFCTFFKNTGVYFKIHTCIFENTPLYFAKCALFAATLSIFYMIIIKYYQFFQRQIFTSFLNPT